MINVVSRETLWDQTKDETGMISYKNTTGCVMVTGKETPGTLVIANPVLVAHLSL